MFARLFCIAVAITLTLVKLTAIARAETPVYERVFSALTFFFEPKAREDRVLLIVGGKSKADL